MANEPITYKSIISKAITDFNNIQSKLANFQFEDLTSPNTNGNTVSGVIPTSDMPDYIGRLAAIKKVSDSGSVSYKTGIKYCKTVDSVSVGLNNSTESKDTNEITLSDSVSINIAEGYYEDGTKTATLTHSIELNDIPAPEISVGVQDNKLVINSIVSLDKYYYKNTTSDIGRTSLELASDDDIHSIFN